MRQTLPRARWRGILADVCWRVGWSVAKVGARSVGAWFINAAIRINGRSSVGGTVARNGERLH